MRHRREPLSDQQQEASPRRQTSWVTDIRRALSDGDGPAADWAYTNFNTVFRYGVVFLLLVLLFLGPANYLNSITSRIKQGARYYGLASTGDDQHP